MNRLDYLQQLLDAGSADAFVLFAIAKEYEKAGDEARALDFYLRLKETDPAYVGLYYHLGKLYEKNGEIAAAVDVYKAGIKTARASGDAHAASELMGALMQWEDTE